MTLAQGHWPEPSDYVFTDAHGRAMTGFEAGRRWRVALKAAGVPARPFHSARHFVHTLLDQEGMNATMIDAIFGHTDARMRATYTHSTPEARGMAAEIIERALGG